jgi:hypothetical protein
MSKSKTIHDTEPKRCTECDEIVALVKKPNRQLVAQCACEELDVKVSSLPPETWQ